MARPRIIVLVGLPGSGKSTYARERGWPVVSSDEMRRLLLDDVTEQRENRRVFMELRRWLRVRLELGRPVTCVDATNLTLRERRPYVKMGELYECAVEAVFFDVALEVCKERNRGRERVVPEEVLEWMARKLARPTEREGFQMVTIVGAEGARGRE